MPTDELSELIEQVRTELTELECEGELMDAARFGDIDVVRAILHVHPLLHNRKDRHGNTPLHMSCANGHLKVTEVLLRLSADVSATNNSGNTPLHWASTNGHDEIVQVLLKAQNVDVLQQNQFGRSALTEGFTSQNIAVVKSLLDHESATEERLVQPMGNHSNSVSAQNTEIGNARQEGDESSHETGSIVHQLIFQGVEVEARELPIAESEEDAILGQANPCDDTTGLGIWAASLVLAQWLVSKVNEDSGTWSHAIDRVVELGAGCGVPSLALAKSLTAKMSNRQTNGPTSYNCQIYGTDFNPKTVDNLRHNIDQNKSAFGNGINVEAMVMNWRDPTTWPKEPEDCLIGSDLIYQSDMVALLIQTIVGLLKPESSTNSVFFYVARADGQRQGHQELLTGLESANFVRREYLAPAEYTQSNPLQSQDDDLCFMHFHELQTTQYTLYEFRPR